MKQNLLIIGEIRNFEHPNWTDELDTLTLYIFRDLVREHPHEFAKDSAHNWAAALIWYVVRILDPCRGGSLESIPLSFICDWFETNGTAIGNRFNEIEKIIPWNENHPFPQKYCSGENPDLFDFMASQINEDFEEVVDQRCIVELEISHIRKLNRARKLQIVSLVQEECEELSKLYGVIDILEWNLDLGSHFVTCSLDSSMAAIFKLGYEIQNKANLIISNMDLISESNYVIEEKSNLYTPDYEYDRLFENSPSMMDKRGTAGLEINDRKQELWKKAIHAFDMRYKESIEELDQILQADPECIEAHLCRIGWMEDPEKRIDALDDLVEMAERILGINDKVADKNMWWTDLNTRPYMRTLKYFGIELLENNYVDEGMEIFEEMLEMNPNDDQNVSESILFFGIKHRKLSNCQRVFASNPENSTFILYCKAFYSFLKFGNKSKAKKAALHAFKHNPHPMLLIKGMEELLDDDTQDIEALVEDAKVMMLIGVCVERHQKLVNWLLKLFIEMKIERESLYHGEAKIIPFQPN